MASEDTTSMQEFLGFNFQCELGDPVSRFLDHVFGEGSGCFGQGGEGWGGGGLLGAYLFNSQSACASC